MNERRPVRICFNDAFWRHGYIEDNKIYVEGVGEIADVLDDDVTISNESEEDIVAKDKNVSGFPVGRKHNPELAGQGWTKLNDKGEAQPQDRDGWKTVKKDKK
jgi:hypothetical protein